MPRTHKFYPSNKSKRFQGLANLPKYERIFWFDGQVRGRRYPNAATLAHHFELHTKTAQRTIEFLRDRMAAPLEYNASQKGYFYSDNTFELPHFQTTQEEILAILIARNLLLQSAGGIISQSLQKFIQKLFSETGTLGLSESQLEQGFSASWIGYSPTASDTFRLSANALLNHRLIKFQYVPPGSSIESTREVEPHHLQHYMGSWVMIAWCRLRKDWRKFYLSRMKNVQILTEAFVPKPTEEWQYQIDHSFGIFQGQNFETVTLQFTPFRAGWIREQIWHPRQKMTSTADGGLELSLPVSDFREIKLKILQFGADVEVLEPVELRREVEAEICRMAELYKSGK
jgi:predicted DNA-binding transcriptional regulator YafY